MPRLTPLNEFKFQDYNNPTVAEGAPEHATLTCVNHQNLRWMTKNPYQRNIHYLGAKSILDYVSGKTDKIEFTDEDKEFMWAECECPFSDLRVIEEDK